VSASNKTRRRLFLGLLALGTALSATAFSLILNKTQPEPDGTGLPIKWPAGSVRIRFQLGDTTDLSDGSSFNQSARVAAQTWNAEIGSVQFQTEVAATGAPVQQTSAQQPPINEVGFAPKLFGRDFDRGTLAVTTGFQAGNERLESDITFNSNYTWDSYRGAMRRNSQGDLIPDIRRVALHELGHVLGLDHPDEAGQFVDAIMNSRINDRYELSADDISGAHTMYGPPGVPANDSFANAATPFISGAQSVIYGYNTNATKESGEPSHADDGGPNPKPNPGGRSVWWRWAAPASGNVTLDTRGSYFDTILGVYTGGSLATLTRVASSDDIDPGRIQASKVSFRAVSGTIYRIAVDGFNNEDGNGADSGSIILNLAFDGDATAAPVITTQPTGTTAVPGTVVTFSVTATGTGPLTYQWYFNDNPIPGATSATYSFTASSTAQNGTYYVVVTNASGSAFSSNATLTVNSPPPTTPPASGGGGGGGGGGAPSLWFLAALALLAAARKLR
jgi:hypothetical protein